MKKILLLILVWVLVLSNAIFVFGAEEKVQHYEKNAFLSDLGIDDGITGNQKGEISRAEFTAMVVRAVHADSTLFSGDFFTDVADCEFRQEIYAARSLGITNGTSETSFSPDGGITVSVAAKMMVAALEYSAKAEGLGGYPTGYIRVASALKLFDGVSMEDEALTVSDAYILIYNMLMADKATFQTMNQENILYAQEKGANLLTENFSLKKESGVLHTVNGLGIEYALCGGDELIINGKLLQVNRDYSELLGYYAEVWYDENNTVAGIDIKRKNDVEMISASEVLSYSNHILQAEIGERTKKFKIADGYVFILNGRAIAAVADDFKFSTGTLYLIDNDRDGEYEYVVAEQIEYFVISGINTAKNEIYDAKSPLKCISLENTAAYTATVTMDGEAAEIGDLKKNILCRVLMSRDGGLCRITCSDREMSGKVTSLDNDCMYVDETEYKLSDYWFTAGDKVTMGSEYSFLLSEENEIICLSSAEPKEMAYGFVMNYAAGSGLSEYKIKLLETTGRVSVYSIGETVIADGRKTKTDTISARLLSGGKVKYQVIRYRTDGAALTHIDFAEEVLSSWQTDNQREERDSLHLNTKELTIKYASTPGFGIPGVPLKSAGVIFAVPQGILSSPGESYQDDAFKVINSDELNNNAEYVVDVYDYDESFIPGAVVVYNTSISEIGFVAPADAGTGYMVQKLTMAVDDEGEVRRRLVVFDGNKYQYLFFNSVVESYLEQKYRFPSPGDVIRLRLDSQDEIIGLAIDVNYDEQYDEAVVDFTGNYGGVDYTQTGSSWAVGTSANSYLTYFTGKAERKSDSYLAITPETVPQTLSGELNGFVNLSVPSSASVIIYDTIRKEAYKGSMQDIVTAYEAGSANASYVVCKSRYYEVNAVFIYLK